MHDNSAPLQRLLLLFRLPPHPLLVRVCLAAAVECAVVMVAAGIWLIHVDQFDDVECDYIAQNIVRSAVALVSIAACKI